MNKEENKVIFIFLFIILVPATAMYLYYGLGLWSIHYTFAILLITLGFSIFIIKW